MTEIVDECQLKYIRHSSIKWFTYREAVTDTPSMNRLKDGSMYGDTIFSISASNKIRVECHKHRNCRIME